MRFIQISNRILGGRTLNLKAFLDRLVEVIRQRNLEKNRESWASLLINQVLSRYIGGKQDHSKLHNATCLVEKE